MRRYWVGSALSVLVMTFRGLLVMGANANEGTSRSTSVCGMPRDAKLQETLLWDATRAAIAATQASAGAQDFMANVSRFDRTVSRDGKVIASEAPLEGAIVARRPYITLSPDVVAKSGYVVDDSTQVAYYAPDADILLSPSFIDSHCFDVQKPTSVHKEWIGLAFRPREDHTGVKDIAGTFWLDRASNELRQIAFRYTNVPSAYQAANVGGNIWFAHLDNGRWLISQWEIRMPQGQVQSRIMLQHSQARDQTMVSVEALRVAGGVVQSVKIGNEVIRLTSP